MKSFLQDTERLILIGFVLVAAFVVSQFVRSAFNRYVKRSSQKLQVNPTNYSFIKNASSFVIYILAVIIIFHLIPGLERIGSTLLASAGILSVIIGLAAQQTFGNIISGIFIVIYKPFRVGDLVQLSNGHTGIVEDITLRHTIIRNPENRRLIVPNTVISNDTLINSNLVDDQICNLIDVGIAYEADVEKAMQLISAIAQQHPDFYDNRTEAAVAAGIPPVIVRVTALGDSSVNLRAAVWCRNVSRAYPMKCDLLLAIKKQFEEAHIEIPYPKQMVILQTSSA